MWFSKTIQIGVVTLIAISVSSIALGGCITDSSKQPDSVSDPNQLYSPSELTDNSFGSVLNNSSFFILDFYYPGCGPCKSMNNTTSELSDELQGQIEFGRMNVRERENSQTVKKYKVSAYPTLLFFDEGVLVSRMKGNITKSNLLAELKDLKPRLDTSKVKLQPTASDDIALAKMGETKPTKPMLITDSNIDSAAKKYPYLVIDGFTTWCEYCKPSNVTLEQLSSELKDKVAFGLIDIDKNKATKAKYNITSYPTLLIFKNGELQDKLIGDKGKSVLVSELKKYYPDLETSNVNLTKSSTAAKAQAAAKPKLTPEQACANMTKSDKPLLEVFVVSQCPFGLQMQRIMEEIVSKLPQTEDHLKVRYIGSVSNNTITSMHGDKEAQENLRQICIREEQPDKYWDYVKDYIKEGESTECLKSSAIDENKLNACIKDSSRGLAYAQKDFDRANEFSITGSPTLIMGNKMVSEYDFATNTTNARSPEALKELLCCGFNEEPSFCDLQLNKTRAITMFEVTPRNAATVSAGQQQKPLGSLVVPNVSVDDDPVRGLKDAPVTIIEFSDFQCPYSKHYFDETLSMILSNYSDRIQYVYRDFPVASIHPNAPKTAEAAQCAFEQGKFWEYHDMLYKNQGKQELADLKAYAVVLGLDERAFNLCLDSGKYAGEVEKDVADGKSYGVYGSPTFFINGRKVVGALPYATFRTIIDEELSKVTTR